MIADLVIRGGHVVDGSGGAPYHGDVAIEGDHIVYAGPHYSGDARETIEAADLIVTPGFVDIHTHYDGQAIWGERMSPSSSHGVTTVVMGNCGVGFAPCRKDDREALIRVMEGVEDIPGAVMADGLAWDWETFPDYLAALERRARDIDVAALLPHSPLRVYVMGERGIRREAATESDLAAMRALAREALDAGAIGFATSRLLIHRTRSGDQIPSHAASVDELVAIADAMKEADTGVLQMVLDAPFASWTDELAHLSRVVESCGRPATFTLGTANYGPPVWLDALGAVDAARACGLALMPQILPRPIGLISSWELSTHPFCLCPAYAALADLPLAEQLPTLKDTAFRALLIGQTPAQGHPLAMMTRNWDWMFAFGDPPLYEPSAESSIGAQARASGRPPEEIAYDQLMARNGSGMILNTLGNFHENRLDALLPLMRRTDTVLGLGDGGAHYAAICDASFPTFLLTYWVRDRAGERLSLEEAVHALTAKPALAMGLADRGQLLPGYKADINVIDLAALTLHAPTVKHDLPGSGRRLDQGATGYVATICNGEIIRSGDHATGRTPGRVVRGCQSAPAVRKGI